MTVLENVELRDNDYRELSEVHTGQKIKLRSASYATISSVFANFVARNRPAVEQTVETSNTTVSTVPSAEITEVVAVNPRIAQLITLLDVQGKLSTEGHKTLKIRPAMFSNMLQNSASEPKLEKVVAVEDKADAKTEEVVETSQEPVAPVVEKETVEVQVAPVVEAVSEEKDMFRASQNGSSVAKLEKFAQTPTELVNNDAVIEKGQVEATKIEEEHKVVSPVIIEEQRPVSREVPLVAPVRTPVVEDKKEMVAETSQTIMPEVPFGGVLEPKQTVLPEVTPKKLIIEPAVSAKEIADKIDNFTDLSELRAYLAETARLQHEAELARNKASEAKAQAAKAEQEAANRRDELLRTAEKIAVHNQHLIAETEENNAQADMYETRRGEAETQNAEYQRAIEDMMALMGNEPQDNKGKER